MLLQDIRQPIHHKEHEKHKDCTKQARRHGTHSAQRTAGRDDGLGRKLRAEMGKLAVPLNLDPSPLLCFPIFLNVCYDEDQQNVCLIQALMVASVPGVLLFERR